MAEVDAVMLVGFFSMCMFVSAIRAWICNLIEDGENSRLCAWSTVYSVGGNGIGIIVSGYAVQHFAPAAAAAFICLIFLAPLLVFPIIPAPPPDEVLASENFSRFARDVLCLLKRHQVLAALPLLALLFASFALTSVLGGWSGNFHATPSFVRIISGIGIVVGSIGGCALVPSMVRKVPLRFGLLSSPTKRFDVH